MLVKEHVACRFWFNLSHLELSVPFQHCLLVSVLNLLYYNFQIKGPSGEQIHGFRDKTSEKYEFVAYKKGIYQFCFTNKSPYHETIDFDVHVAHYAHYDQHAKDGNYPLGLGHFLSCSLFLC